MASVLPKPTVDRIQWCESRIAQWTLNAVAMGSSVAAVSDYETKTEAARAALTARDLAANALRDANINLRLATAAMTDAASGIIKAVKGKAEVAGDSVYSLSSIPVPATPGPRPDPGTPTDFKVELNNDGSINLTWACNNSGNSGTQYQVWRQLEGETEWSGRGATGLRKFVDATIPAGTKSVTYKIQATRTTGGGPWGTFVVNFGIDTAGGTTASVKLAA